MQDPVYANIGMTPQEAKEIAKADNILKSTDFIKEVLGTARELAVKGEIEKT